MTVAMRRPWLAAAPLSLLIACAAEPGEEPPPGLTAAEDRQLDAAAERLDREREDYEAGLAAQQAADAASTAQSADPTDPAANGAGQPEPAR